MYEKFGQFIDGKWQQSSDKGTYEVINPATEEVLGNVSKATPDDVDRALRSAEKGLEVWKKTAPWQRSYIIRRIADKMREKQDVLAKWMTLEVGKPLAEAKGEINGAADIFEWNAEETKRIFGQTIESRFKDTRVHVYYQPVGVVAALSPWNFPAVLSARKISTALAAGCSVIIKPDVITPGVVMEMVNICSECGVPPGVVNLLSGDPPSIAQQLISSDIIKKISITGSSRVGKLILKQAADKVQRVTMELSGHSPFIVFDDADIKKATDMAQMCCTSAASWLWTLLASPPASLWPQVTTLPPAFSAAKAYLEWKMCCTSAASWAWTWLQSPPYWTWPHVKTLPSPLSAAIAFELTLTDNTVPSSFRSAQASATAVRTDPASRTS